MLPMRSVERATRRAEAAYQALAAAESFAEAGDAWEDFLIHLRRALNRCDAEAKRQKRPDYVRLDRRIPASAALAYLWAARNADEHGLEEIAERQEKTLAIGAFGGYREEVDEPGPNGEVVYRYTPLSDDPPPFFAVVPEHLKLRPVPGRRGQQVPVPDGYAYDIGEVLAPVALAQVGLEFLLGELATLRAWNSA